MITLHGIYESGATIVLWSSSETPEDSSFNYRAVILDSARQFPNMIDFSLQITCDVCSGRGINLGDYENPLCASCKGECCVPADALANGRML